MKSTASILNRLLRASMHKYGLVDLGLTRQGKPLLCPFGLNPIIVCTIFFSSVDLQWCNRTAAASFIACSYRRRTAMNCNELHV